MTNRNMRHEEKKGRRRERGFTLTELMVATGVLLFGIVAVAQLVPASIRLNAANRRDSTALAFAQRELNQMAGQPLSATSFVDAQGITCNLGDPTAPNQAVGSPVVVVNNQPMIDFTAGPVAGYRLTYQDANDPSGATYDVRWAVVAYVNSTGSLISKRFILCTKHLNGDALIPPVTLDTIVAK